jgi:hypothetical protein
MEVRVKEGLRIEELARGEAIVDIAILGYGMYRIRSVRFGSECCCSCFM